MNIVFRPYAWIVATSCAGLAALCHGQALPKPEEIARALAPKVQQSKELREKAELITSRIGKLASSGKLPTNDEGIRALQELVQELSKVNDSLKSMQQDIERIKSWMEGQSRSLPDLAGDVENLKRVSWGGYFQFQWSDTQEGFNRLLGDGSTARRTNNDGFQLRRVRLSQTSRIDPKTSARVSVDLAAGGNRLQAELKDAVLRYDIAAGRNNIGVQGLAGQMVMPLGYELERSSSEREMPERSIYNRILMGGERNRGVMVKYGTGRNTYLQAGLWNSLTVNDPQLSQAGTFRNLSGTNLGATVGARIDGKQLKAGISAFFAERPRFSYTDFVSDTNNSTTTKVADGADRRLVYLDGTYVGVLDSRLTLRGELVFGKDRVPTLGAKRQTVGGSSATIGAFPEFVQQTDVLGYHLQATYSLNGRNLLSAKWEYFDPDTGKAGNDQTGLSFSYIYYINAGARLMIGHETFKERSFELRNNVTTIRLQLKI